MEPVLKKHADLFPGYTQELFMKMYNYACTRCFGWTLPSTMMVPLADFMNHLPIDNDYNVYSKMSHSVMQSVNSEKTASSKRGSKKTDYSAIYTKEFQEDSLDPHCQALIKGQLGRKSKKAPVSRIANLEVIRAHMEENMKYCLLGQEDKVTRADIWH